MCYSTRFDSGVEPCVAWCLEDYEFWRGSWCVQKIAREPRSPTIPLFSWVGYENPPWRSSLHAILFKAFLNSAPQLAADVVLPSWPSAGR